MQEDQEFKIIDPKEGIIQLQDRVFGVARRWKLEQESMPGLAVLLDADNHKDIPKSKDELDKMMEGLNDEQLDQFVGKMRRNSKKLLYVLASIVTPDYELPDIFDNKVEALAACLTERTPSQIMAFFFLRYTGGTTNIEDLQKLMTTVGDNAKSILNSSSN